MNQDASDQLNQQAYVHLLQTELDKVRTQCDTYLQQQATHRVSRHANSANDQLCEECISINFHMSKAESRRMAIEILLDFATLT